MPFGATLLIPCFSPPALNRIVALNALVCHSPDQSLTTWDFTTKKIKRIFGPFEQSSTFNNLLTVGLEIATNQK
jgi:hypothetical protein